jgi:protein-disulfide isomerase
MESSGLNIKNVNQWALISFALMGFIAGYGINEVIDVSTANVGGSPVVADKPTNPTPTPPRPTAIPTANAAEIEDDTVLGDEDAPVTMIEFTDYECTFCGRHYKNTFGQIKSEYIDTGKVKYVVRDYPLGFHQKAQKAAEATECADDQGKFWEMHEKLFEKTPALSVPELKTYAGELGLNQSDFDDCLDSGKYEDEVKKDQADGSASGITGTPGFYVNDKKLSGAQPFASFKAIIDAELSE